MGAAKLLPLLLLMLPAAPEYAESIRQWRAEREARLKADDGWLTVAGLFWLKPGNNAVGSDPAAPVALPAGSAPARVGVIELKGDAITFRPDPKGGAMVNGKPAAAAVSLKPDVSGSPVMVTVRDLTFFVIKRGDRYAIRMRDKNSEARRRFQGLDWYAADPQWNKSAKWVAFPKPRRYKVKTVLGTEQDDEAVGYAVIQHNGQEVRLQASLDEGQLFFVFRDKTAGKTTYPAARFVKADVPKTSEFRLDFNKAYNPPCVFTPYATCPLPVAGNRLSFPIAAGEKMYRGKT